jgi:hypothetical protein
VEFADILGCTDKGGKSSDKRGICSEKKVEFADISGCTDKGGKSSDKRRICSEKKVEFADISGCTDKGGKSSDKRRICSEKKVEFADISGCTDKGGKSSDKSRVTDIIVDLADKIPSISNDQIINDIINQKKELKSWDCFTSQSGASSTNPLLASIFKPCNHSVPTTPYAIQLVLDKHPLRPERGSITIPLSSASKIRNCPT